MIFETLGCGGKGIQDQITEGFPQNRFRLVQFHVHRHSGAIRTSAHSTPRLLCHSRIQPKASKSRSAILASPVAKECKEQLSGSGGDKTYTHKHTQTISTLDTTDEAFIRCAHSV
jgi:hypothetical protein